MDPDSGPIRAPALAAVVFESMKPEDLIQFYRDAFALPPARGRGKDHLGIKLPNGGYLGFTRVDEASLGPGRVSIWFQVDDVDAAFERLRRLNAKVRTEPEDLPDERIATVFDPDDNVLGIFARPSGPPPA